MFSLKLIVSAVLLTVTLAGCTGFGAGGGDNCRVVTTDRDGDDAQRLTCK